MGRVSRPSSRVRIGGVWITPWRTTVEVAGADGATSALAAAARTSALFILPLPARSEMNVASVPVDIGNGARARRIGVLSTAGVVRGSHAAPRWLRQLVAAP